MNIGAKVLQIAGVGRLDGHCLVSALKQMPADLVAGVVTLGIGPLQPFHSGDQVCFRSFEQEMIMISHQHVGVNAPAGFGAGLAEGFHPALPVSVIFEDGAALIASGHDVIGCSWVFDAQWSGHNSTIRPVFPPKSSPKYQFPRTDPKFRGCLRSG